MLFHLHFLNEGQKLSSGIFSHFVLSQTFSISSFNSYYSDSYKVILVFLFKDLLFLTVEFLFSSYEFFFA